jgi:ribosomal protein S18 acetylase RimI-like enzyme
MGAESIVIRPLAAGDIEALRALAAQIWHEHYTAIIGTAQIQYMLEQRYRPEVLHEELRRAGLWWDLLLIDDVPRGYSSYFLTGEHGELRLDKLYLHGACRRRGHGERMLERVLAQARASGCNRVSLAVNKRNTRAITAYQKWGFAIEQAVVKDIGGGFVMDDYVMVRPV